jgi:hypothetical protein
MTEPSRPERPAGNFPGAQVAPTLTFGPQPTSEHFSMPNGGETLAVEGDSGEQG